jgi:hypothetical protein
MKSPFKIFLLKLTVFIVPVLLLFETLFRLGFYPIITNSTLFDAKMLAIQRQHVKKIELLSIGSSINLYDLNSDIIVKNFDMPYYNLGSWGLQITDMRALLNGFVKEYHPKYVVLCSSFTDFISPPNDTYANYINTDFYLKDNFPEIFYFKDYHSIHQIVRRKYKAYPLNFDQWGGAALKLTLKDIVWNKWNEHGIFPTKYTSQNYKDLDSLAAFLKQQNIKFIFMQAPIKKSYANTVLSKQIIQSHFDKCRAITESRGGTYLSYYKTDVFTDNYFTDQYHLQAAGAVVLTGLAVADLRKVIKP